MYQNSILTVNSFYDNGNIHTVTRFQWENGVWNLWTKMIQEWSENRISQLILQHVVNGEFVNNYKYNFNYNGFGNYEMMQLQFWDEDHWVNDRKREFVYNE